MTIAPYYINTIINAYNKQDRIKVRTTEQQEVMPGDKYQDIVSLSEKGIDKADAYKKISYSLVDVILKDK